VDWLAIILSFFNFYSFISVILNFDNFLSNDLERFAIITRRANEWETQQII